MSEGYDEREAMTRATAAVKKILTASKDKRTILGRMKPGSVAYHAAYAAIDAYRQYEEECRVRRL